MTHSVNQLINYEAVCRTAPATPGLSINLFDGLGQGTLHVCLYKPGI